MAPMLPNNGIVRQLILPTKSGQTELLERWDIYCTAL